MNHWNNVKENHLLYNLGYFLKELKTMLRLNLLFHILSIISIGLIFFILSMVISGWWASNKVVEGIQSEAEVNVYFNQNLNDVSTEELLNKIKALDGVQEARVVNKDEAYRRMEEILGQEARVLQYLDDNPFSPFIEIKINLDKIDYILEKLNFIEEIEYIRDNRQILKQISNIAETLRLLGYLVLATVGFSTLVIISHIIRLGIHNSREQVNTLRLLGAPESFIAIPFLLEGLVLTILGGIFALGLAILTVRYVYEQVNQSLTFIPMLSQETLVNNLLILIMSLSLVTGFTGSLLGFTSATKAEKN